MRTFLPWIAIIFTVIHSLIESNGTYFWEIMQVECPPRQGKYFPLCPPASTTFADATVSGQCFQSVEI